MSYLKVPYLIRLPGRGGVTRFYWQPGKALRAAGWEPRRIPDGWQALEYDPRATEAAAVAAAHAMNDRVAAWRKAGSPVRDGAPFEGTPEDAAAIGAAPALATVEPNSLAHVIRRYRASKEFLKLADSTQEVYGNVLNLLERWGGTKPFAAITAPVLEALHDGLEHVPTRAKAAIVMFSILRKFALRKSVPVGVMGEALPRLQSSVKGGIIWPAACVEAFVRHADQLGLRSIGTAILLDNLIGQRKNDILAIRWQRYVNGKLIIKQRKTAAGLRLPIDVVIPVERRLAEERERQVRRAVTPIALAEATIICNEATGRPYTDREFSHQFERVRASVAAEIPAWELDYFVAGGESSVRTDKLVFRHLRHTAIVRLAEKKVPATLIRNVSGHSLFTVERVLEYYLVRTEAGARAAFEMLIAEDGK